MIRSRAFVFAIAVFGSAAGLPIAVAQDEQSRPEQLAPAYSDAEVKSFAGAVVEVHRINDEYIPRLEAAHSRDEERDLEQAALKEMTEAVENEGLSVDRYQQILSRVQRDRELLQRVKKELRDASRRTRI